MSDRHEGAVAVVVEKAVGASPHRESVCKNLRKGRVDSKEKSTSIGSKRYQLLAARHVLDKQRIFLTLENFWRILSHDLLGRRRDAGKESEPLLSGWMGGATLFWG